MWGGLIGLGALAVIVATAIAYGKALKPRPRPTLQQLIDNIWYDPDKHEWHRKDNK